MNALPILNECILLKTMILKSQMCDLGMHQKFDVGGGGGQDVF